LNGEKKWGETRRKIINFLEENAGGKVQISRLGEKLGVKQGSVYAVLSDLRKLGLLPKLENLQPVPTDFKAEEALKALRSLQRKRDEKRFFNQKE